MIENDLYVLFFPIKQRIDGNWDDEENCMCDFVLCHAVFSRMPKYAQEHKSDREKL